MKSREQEIDQREKSATQVVRDLDERQEAASEFEERLSEREAAVSLRDDDLTQRLDDLRRREVLLEEQQDGLNEEQLLAKSREEELSRLANDLQVREQTLEEWKNNVEAQAAELNTARAEFEQTRVVWLQDKESREHGNQRRMQPDKRNTRLRSCKMSWPKSEIYCREPDLLSIMSVPDWLRRGR